MVVDDRVRIQSMLYPWILLSVMNGKSSGVLCSSDKALRIPDSLVRFYCRDSGQSVVWNPKDKIVSFQRDVLEKSSIGVSFASPEQSVKFFEDSKIKGVRLLGLTRVIQYKRFIHNLLAVQSDLGAKNWEKLSESQLLNKVCVTFYSAIVGLNGLSKLDHFSCQLNKHLPDGYIRVWINGLEDPIAILSIHDGVWEWMGRDCSIDGKSVDFEFKDVKSAWMSAANLTDNLAAVGKGDIRLRGYIPLVDGLNHMLDRLQMYVKAG